MHAADVVKPAVIGLAHDRIDRILTLVAGLHQRIADGPLQACRHTQGVGQDDRRLNVAEFTHLRHARQFAIAVAHIDGSRHLLAEDVALMGHDGSDARAHAVALDEGDMAHRHTRHVGDCIILPCREDSRRETPLAQRLVLLRR